MMFLLVICQIFGPLQKACKQKKGIQPENQDIAICIHIIFTVCNTFFSQLNKFSHHWMSSSKGVQIYYLKEMKTKLQILKVVNFGKCFNNSWCSFSWIMINNNTCIIIVCSNFINLSKLRCFASAAWYDRSTLKCERKQKTLWVSVDTVFCCTQ